MVKSSPQPPIAILQALTTKKRIATMNRAQLAYARKDYLSVFCGYGENTHNVLSHSVRYAVYDKVVELGNFYVIPCDMWDIFDWWVSRTVAYYSDFFKDLSGKTVNIFQDDMEKCAKIILHEWAKNTQKKHVSPQ